jgi:predicted GIY-YIG superfamily endonuclease
MFWGAVRGASKTRNTVTLSMLASRSFVRLKAAINREQDLKLLQPRRKRVLFLGYLEVSGLPLLGVP